ncbi:alpha/beta hydrolase [Tenggerimyces flavus]|uniref:Alpha/beta hydrolase n=1 Tax=Tenggerimyces flavus TaxID=1708749 RepID=A0ABV7YI83_9ACTN|nr:alpha/beta hydrolase [Tenggerimyces flavus]MBM7784741.1 alpha-beta hydrolase superfamily lysophospholipase [Tenggerimyces flavus]
MSTETIVPRADALTFRAPEGLLTRGTVVVIPGRGESPASYRRFGARLAADAYEVRVVARPEGDLDAFAATLGDTTASARPLVVVGSDLGAIVASVLVRRQVLAADALVLAALPRAAGAESLSWDDELATRSFCPTYRQVLTDDPTVERGALAADVPAALLDEALAPDNELPHLILTGSSDPIGAADLPAFVHALPRVQHVIVNGAHHDVLNDLQHRSVAAAVVTFLERLRQPDPADAIIRVAHATWTNAD